MTLQYRLLCGITGWDTCSRIISRSRRLPVYNRFPAPRIHRVLFGPQSSPINYLASSKTPSSFTVSRMTTGLASTSSTRAMISFRRVGWWATGGVRSDLCSLFMERFVWTTHPYVAYTMASLVLTRVASLALTDIYFRSQVDKLFNPFTLLVGPCLVAYLVYKSTIPVADGGYHLPWWNIILFYLSDSSSPLLALPSPASRRLTGHGRSGHGMGDIQSNHRHYHSRTCE